MYEIINESGICCQEIEELDEFIRFIVEQERLNKYIFSISIVDDETIKKLNKEYRNVDRVTDVISFEYGIDDDINNPEVQLLGEIFISINKARYQSLEYGHSLKRELSFLTVHGILHLLGYDHINKEDEIIMFKHQGELLEKAGIVR